MLGVDGDTGLGIPAAGIDGACCDIGKVIGDSVATGSEVDEGDVAWPQQDTRAASIKRKVAAMNIFFVIYPKT